MWIGVVRLPQKRLPASRNFSRFDRDPHADRRRNPAPKHNLAQWIFEEFRLSIAVQTLSRELRKMGYRKLSARPRHHAQAGGRDREF